MLLDPTPTGQHLETPKGTVSEKRSARMTTHIQPSSLSPGMSHEGLGYPRSPDDSYMTYPGSAC